MMSNEASWAVIGVVCGIAVAGAWAWFITSRQLDAAFDLAFKP